jgi:sugar/nucleoside kinase (ribokinase family)
MLNTDHIYRVERMLGDGEAVVNEAKSFPDGSAANTIYGLAKLGAREGFPTLIELTQRDHELYNQQL